MKREALPALALALASAGLLAAVVDIAHARGTDVKIESNDLDLVLNQKREKEDRFGIPVDDSTSIGFNEDGDPALSRNF